MKIGILTFHRALNYGAVLQCYALFETLKNMGHDVEVIDYRPPYIEKYRKLFYKREFKKMSVAKKIDTLLKLPLTYWSKRKAIKAFDEFLFQHLQFSYLVRTASDIPSYYDVIVFGSDQIWNPRICEGFDSIYWGQFEKGKTRYVTYAPSMEGYDFFSKEQWGVIKKMTKIFNAISVREEVLKMELKKWINRYDVEWVLDPTLLTSPNILRSLTAKPFYEKYVFLFTVQDRQLPYMLAKQLAELKNLSIVTVHAIPRLNILSKEKNVIKLDACTPLQFLGLIQYADYIVTNSFHATALSIQMEKEFYSVQCPRPKRIQGILSALCLTERFVKSFKEIKEGHKIDYYEVNNKMKIMRKSSLQYLKNNL